MNKKITIAKVNSVFGIKGEVKLIIYSDNPQGIENYQIFNAKNEPIKITISNKNKTIVGSSSGNPIVIAKISGIDDRNAAENLRGQEFFVLRSELSELAEDEFYYSDLIGLNVINKNSEKIGKITNVMDLGGGGIVEIEFTQKEAQKNFGKTENFSFKNEFFPEVNLSEGFVIFDAPDLLEIKTSEEE